MKFNPTKKLSLFLTLILVSTTWGFSQLTSIMDFSTYTGYEPSGILVNNSYLYGITQNGGESLMGTFFKTSMDGLSYTLIKAFDENAPYPCSIISDDTHVYVTTRWSENGNGNGFVFRYNTISEKLDTLLEFPAGILDNPSLEYITDSVI